MMSIHADSVSRPKIEQVGGRFFPFFFQPLRTTVIFHTIQFAGFWLLKWVCV